MHPCSSILPIGLFSSYEIRGVPAEPEPPLLYALTKYFSLPSAVPMATYRVAPL